MKHCLLVFALLATPLAACSSSAETATAKSLAAPAQVAEFSSASLFAEINAVPAATRQASLLTIRQLPVNTFYQMLLAHTADVDVVVDGKNYGNALTAVKASATFFAAVADHYPNIGAFWDEAGMTARLGSEGQFVEDVRAALGGSTEELGLLDGTACGSSENGSCAPVAATTDSKCTQNFWAPLAQKGVTQNMLTAAFSQLDSARGGSVRTTSTMFWPDGDNQGVTAQRAPITGLPNYDTWSLAGLSSVPVQSSLFNHYLNMCMSGGHKPAYGTGSSNSLNG